MNVYFTAINPAPPPDFGTVLELRINSGGKLPNFGFVVFDDPEPVQKILSNRVTRPPPPELSDGSKCQQHNLTVVSVYSR